MALKSLRHVKLDDQKGVLYSAGHRSLIVPADFLIGVSNTLNKIIGNIGSRTIIRTIGLDLGKYYAKTLKSILVQENIKLDNEMLFREACNAVSMTAGWGKIIFEEFDLNKNRYTIKIENSPTENGDEKNSYSFERGIIIGAFREIFNKDIFFEIIERNKKKHFIIIKSRERLSKEYLKKEELVIFERNELEKKIRQRTSQLISKTEEIKKSKLKLEAVLLDVKKARDEAKYERNKAMALIDHFSDGIVVFNRKNILTLINPQAEKILSVKGRELLKKSFLELRSFTKIRPVSDFFKGKIKEIDRQIIEVEEGMTIEVTIVDLKKISVNGGFMMIIHDVSREKMIDRLKSEFITVAAHQLRTPLSAIKWSLKMIIDGDIGKITVAQKSLLMQTFHSNERMIVLVNDMLNVAAIEEGRFDYKFSIIHLDDLISTILSDYTYKIQKKKINFIYNKPATSLPKAKIDHAKIRLAFQNLLDNAIKYTPDGGDIKVNIFAKRNFIFVLIKDSGIGIPPLEQNRLFGKFYRSDIAVKRQTEGSGLGLFIAKNIIEKHGGKIGFKSRGIDQGSEFWFKLPLN